MNHGAGGTLKLHPHGKDPITFSLDGAMPTGTDAYTMIVDCGRLRLNEADRVQWSYEDGNDGGRAVSRKMQLVPVVFPVVIKATSATARLTAYNALMAAVTNRRGGVLEYAPENPAGLVSTFYHYQASGAPVLFESSGNRWDANVGSDGLFTLEADVELQTQPIATSDPDTPVTLFTPDSGYSDALVGIDGELPIINLKGTESALLRIVAYGASNQDVGRVIMFRKSGAGKDADHIIDSASAAIEGVSQYWSVVSDADRYGGSYRRLNPPSDANDTEFVLRFSLPDPAYWEGTFAVFAIGNDETGVLGAWLHRVRLRMGGVTVQESSEHYAADFQNWRLVYGGEIEFPPTTLSQAEKVSGYGSDVYLDWVCRRGEGTGAFGFDAFVLVQVRDQDGNGCVLDVMCDGEDAIAGDSARLLVENLAAEDGRPLDVAHVLTTGLQFSRSLSVAPRGEFLTLDPSVDHTLRMIEERKVAPAFVDDLAAYNAQFFGQVGHFDADIQSFRQLVLGPHEPSEGWMLASGECYYSTFSIVQSDVWEGYYYGKLVATTNSAQAGYVRVVRDLLVDFTQDTRFTEDDFLCFCRKWDDDIAAVNYARVGFIDSGGTEAYANMALLTSGYVNEAWKRSDLVNTGTIDWGRIQQVFVDYGVDAGAGNLNSELWIDHIRVEKADPTDATQPNATGGKWVFNHGKYWTLTSDTARYPFNTYYKGNVPVVRRDPGVTLACMPDGRTGPSVSATGNYKAMLDEDAPMRFRYRARLSNPSGEGFISILWCMDAAGVTGALNGYEIGFRYDMQPYPISVWLGKYTNGVYGTPNGLSGSQVLWSLYGQGYHPFLAPVHVGVEVDRNTGLTNVYAVLEGDTVSDGDLWSASNLLFTYTDTAFMTNTKVGLMVTGWGELRADKIELRDNTHRVYASDDLRVAVTGQYRTVTPLTP